MKVLKIILINIVILILLLLILMFYIGMFNKMEVKQQEMGPYVIAYEPFVGPYSKTASAFNNVYDVLKENGIESQVGLGIYYDDPSKVPADKLRSDCGSVLTGENINKVILIEGKINIKDIDRSKCIVTTFPIKNSLSYMFGPIKAYPALMEYAQKNKLELGELSYEVYDMPNKVIYYVFQIK